MTDDNTNYRWIPASELGRALRFGDFVSWGKSGKLGWYECHDGMRPGHRWVRFADDRYPSGFISLSVPVSDLLVRQPVREAAGDAFRREITKLREYAEAAKRHAEGSSIVTYYEGMIAAYEAVLQIPTPAEGDLMLWDAHDTEHLPPYSNPHKAAEFVADATSPDDGPFVVRLQVARLLPDRFMLMHYDRYERAWECVSEHASQAEADEAKAGIPTPTETDAALIRRQFAISEPEE